MPSRASSPIRLGWSILALLGFRVPTLRGATVDTVVVERIASLPSRALGSNRTVDVFLPPGYDPRGTARYGVLYANDGQDMAAAGLGSSLERLVRERRMRPVIVVAIHASDRRTQEYGTTGIPNAQGLGSDAGRLERFLLDELIPLINRRYRTLEGPGETAIMGWSLGGLSAFDIAWRHPERFGAVGVFSGSFWWRTSESTVAAKQSSRIMHRVVRETPAPHPNLRCWFETGQNDETDDRDGNGVIDSIQDTEELMDELARKGYRRGQNMVHVSVDGGHDVETWAKVLPEWLTWAFPNR